MAAEVAKNKVTFTYHIGEIANVNWNVGLKMFDFRGLDISILVLMRGKNSA